MKLRKSMFKELIRIRKDQTLFNNILRQFSTNPAYVKRASRNTVRFGIYDFNSKARLVPKIILLLEA